MNRKYNKLNQGPHNRLRHLVQDPGITPLSSACLGRFWSVVHVQQTSETTYPSSRRTRGFGDVACMCKDAVLSSAGAFQTEGGMLDFHACVLQRGTLPLRRGLPFPQARGDTPVGDDMPGGIPWVLHPSLVCHVAACTNHTTLSMLLNPSHCTRGGWSRNGQCWQMSWYWLRYDTGGPQHGSTAFSSILCYLKCWIHLNPEFSGHICTGLGHGNLSLRTSFGCIESRRKQCFLQNMLTVCITSDTKLID